MPRVKVRDLKPGQVVAAPVTSGAGVILVQAGAALTATQIARLADMGIDSVVVSGGGVLTAEERARVLADLDARFAGHEQHRWMTELKEIVARILVGGPSPDA